MSRTLRNTRTRMKHVLSMVEDFTKTRRDAAEKVMKAYDISGSELALNLGHSSMFEGLVSPASRKQRQLLSVCYKGFVQLSQDLAVLNREQSFLLDECRGLVNTLRQEHVKHGYSLPAMNEDDMEIKLDALMKIFINEDPLFIDMFHGKPPKRLVKAARNYQLSFEIHLSLNVLGEFLANKQNLMVDGSY